MYINNRCKGKEVFHVFMGILLISGVFEKSKQCINHEPVLRLLWFSLSTDLKPSVACLTELRRRIAKVIDEATTKVPTIHKR